MYESLYRLSRRPFAPTPALAFYVPNASSEAALDGLEHAVREDQGIGILTAEVGLGKTLVCQQLAERLADEYTVVFLSSSNYPNSRALLQAILYEIGHPYTRLDEQELRLELQTALRELREDTRGLVLIVDEANFLSDELLEEIRTLTHLAIDGVPLIRVVLSAHMSFEERLIDRQMEPLNQRIGCHVFLEPLSHEESISYVAARLQLADGNVDEILTTDALLAICQASGGVPRCLNQLCDHTLLLGYAFQEQPITIERVHEALEDLKPLPLQWNNLPSAPIPEEHAQFCEESAEDEANVDTEEQVLEPSDTDVAPVDASEDAAVFEFGSDEVADGVTPPVMTTEISEPVEASVFEVGGDEDTEFSTSDVDTDQIPSVWTNEPVGESMESNVIEFGSPDESSVSDVVQEPAPTSEEHHVIVPPTPTWRQTPETIETERVRQAVGPYAWSFAEEAVTDRYSALDAGRSIDFSLKSIATTSVCPTVQLRCEEQGWLPAEPSPFAKSSLPVEWIEDEVPSPSETPDQPVSHSNPLDTIDAILPQVESALNDGIESQETVEPVENAPANAADVLQSVEEQIAEFHNSDSEVDLETEIGALVLDTCVSTQAELYGSPRNREVDQQLAAALEDTLAEKLGTSKTEASESEVQPKQKSIAEQLAEAAHTEHEIPQPKQTRKYGSLFTKLRRKLRS
ncbi:ExeA family protein [Thalassoroseus pseudoceratinae]|uniref:ExeA family protein n=1 Tax=Thalassoroseus pseudoceratinae TaxID=2713176 RepID=UPI001423DC54|nr:AAA family ATPase [Thalassoroseus pseudoceratinae]